MKDSWEDPKTFYKHFERNDLVTDKQIKKFRKRYRRPDLKHVYWFYAGIFGAMLIGKLIQYIR